MASLIRILTYGKRDTNGFPQVECLPAVLLLGFDSQVGGRVKVLGKNKLRAGLELDGEIRLRADHDPLFEAQLQDDRSLFPPGELSGDD